VAVWSESDNQLKAVFFAIRLIRRIFWLIIMKKSFANKMGWRFIQKMQNFVEVM